MHAAAEPSATPAFLACGEMGAIMRGHDWAATPLGDPSTWPQPLRTALSICLGSPQIGAVLWGPDHLLLYNDAYAELLADRHPRALGRPILEVWAEIAHVLAPQLAGVRATGRGMATDDQALVLEPADGPRETHWIYSFAPIHGEDRPVAGIFNTATETTSRVRAERTRHESERRLRQAADATGLSADFRALFEASPTPFLVVAPPDWTIVAVNDARVRLLGLAREEQVGRGLFELYPDDPDDPGATGVRNLTTSLERVVATKAPDPMAIQRYDVREADGRFVERWWSPINTPVLDRAGEVALVIHRVEEVTEAVRLRGEAAARDQIARDQQAVIDRLRATEEALRENEARLSAVFAQASVGLSEIALDGRFVRVNDRLCAILGRSRESLLSARIAEVTDPGDVAPSLDHFGRVVATGVPASFDKRYRRPDGTMVWANSSLSRLDDELGRPQAVLAVTVDLTERHRAQEALRASEEFNRRILSSSADCIKVLDLEGRLAFMSEGAMCAMEVDDFGAIKGLCWPDFWQGGEHAMAVAAVEEARRGGTGRFQGFATTMKGSARWWDVIVTPIAGPDGRPETLLSISRDITAAKQAEMRLGELNATLEAEVAARTAERDRMWETSPDLMVVIDFAGVFRRVNPAWTALLGYATDELEGRHVNEFVLPDDHGPTIDAYELAGRGGRPRIENRYRHKDGSTRWISWTAAPTEDLTYATGRDVTVERERQEELLQAQEALRQSQKMEAIGQLTGGVAHDFNNLLTIIKSSTDLLRRPGLPEDRRRRYVDAISDTVGRASKLTGQLLAFARRQALKPEVFAPAERIEAVRDMLRTVVGSRVQIVTHFDGEACFVEADASQFDTALVNMAVNARDAMDGVGRLTIRAEAIPGLPAGRGQPGAIGPFVAVSVSDSGSGIAPDKIAHIFEPFFTTKEVGKGTGLGLSQVYGFVKQSGGDVAVESLPGRGTTFMLYLPRVESAPDPGPTGTAGPGLVDKGGGRRVLVVEDNEEVGRFSTQLLEDLGYVTTWAADGADALALLGEADRFDVVFSDVVMPGMSGVELGEAIRRLNPGLPVVLTSGYSHVLAEEGRHGFELLQKPYAAEELSRVLRRATRGRTTG